MKRVVLSILFLGVSVAMMLAGVGTLVLVTTRIPPQTGPVGHALWVLGAMLFGMLVLMGLLYLSACLAARLFADESENARR
jgi:hypothetical protein